MNSDFLFNNKLKKRNNTINSIEENKYKELYKLIDFFIDNLKYTFKSYGIDGLSFKRVSNDGNYSVFPLGRLIIIKINRYNVISYEELQQKLKLYYMDNVDVNNVYLISKGRAIAVDCREIK